MATTSDSPTVQEPLPIFKLAQRYLVYDADTVTYLRREHNICGVLIGGLPQAPQQNVFSGLPLELLPEEARLLVEKRVAYVVDDVAKHRRAFLEDGMSAEERRAYQAALRKQGLAAAGEKNRKSEQRKKATLEKLGTENWNDLPEDMLKPRSDRRKRQGGSSEGSTIQPNDTPDDETLFDSPGAAALCKASTPHNARSAEPQPFFVTPTTSYPPLQSAAPPSESTHVDAPDAPQSYPIFRYLHDQGYFLAPGLRFGCQYMAYPGDPLRFHSHFLVNGMDWDQEFDLLDLVTGGRLGTGVKKGFLLGGQEEGGEGRDKGAAKSGDETSRGVRSFCIEWGGM
ncbi:tRNA-splicing endonuclease subunit [Saxophila tyrrhenica]|uniref:tRNA-splicing endonuclease subunit Sen34 n=1 Tax=Saxophila tyrrhenica TaxID=1690608 RepID=A0AAV9NZK2_9PEZI|nr:tRNA-splicing endonuclease subunit [Saxophila tyrrhenica]